MARRFECAGVRMARRQWQLLAPLRDLGFSDASGLAARPPADAAERAAAAALWRRRGGRDEPPDHLGVLVTGPDVSGAVWYDPEANERTEYGVAGRIVAVLTTPGRDDLRAGLVAAAMAALRECGLRVAAIAVDAEDHALARSCRLLGFRHDRTDIEYTVGPAPAEATADA
jgi:mycothiol synthase